MLPQRLTYGFSPRSEPFGLNAMIQLRLHWLSGEPVLRNVSVPLDAPLSELRSQLNAAAGKPIRALIAGSKQQLDWRCTVSQAGLQNNETVMALAEERPQP